MSVVPLLPVPPSVGVQIGEVLFSVSIVVGTVDNIGKEQTISSEIGDLVAWYDPYLLCFASYIVQSSVVKSVIL